MNREKIKAWGRMRVIFYLVFFILFSQTGCQAQDSEETNFASALSEGFSEFESREAYAQGLKTKFTLVPPSCSDSTTAKFKFKCNNRPCTFKCKLDDGKWKSCKSGKSYSGLAEGAHTFKVRAKDGSGRVEKRPAVYSWKVGVDDDEDGANEVCSVSGGALDCDDSDPNNWTKCSTCQDQDQDLWYWECDRYQTINGPDCDDSDVNNWEGCEFCSDQDLDGWFTDCDQYETISGPDCDDSDVNNWESCGSCSDQDSDGWFGGCDQYLTITGPDCNELDAQNWVSCSSCQDQDLDGHLGTGCDLSEDCDDLDPQNWVSCGLCRDQDLDGYRGTGCDLSEDCDDLNPRAFDFCPIQFLSSSLWSYGLEIGVSGSLGYLLTTAGLAVYDLSDKSNPRELNRIVLPGSNAGFSHSLKIQGNHLYFTHTTNGVYIFELTDPVYPKEVSLIQGDFYPTSLELIGTDLYIGGVNSAGAGELTRYDVSNPGSPVKISHFLDSEKVIELEQDQGKIYLLTPSHLSRIDFSNPSHPVEERVLDFSNESAYHFLIQEGKLYLITNKRIAIYDLSLSPAQLLGSYVQDFSWTHRLALKEGLLFDLEATIMYPLLAPLTVFDVSNPATLKLIDRYEPVVARSLYISGNYLYLPGNLLKILELNSSYGNPVVGEYGPSGWEEFTDCEIYQEDYALLGAWWGFRVLDISDPSSPMVLFDSFSSGHTGDAIAVDGNLGLVWGMNWMDWIYNLYIYDLSIPSQPVLVSSFFPNIWGGPVYLTAEQNLAYLVYGDLLEIVDYSIPTSPFLVSTMNLPCYPFSVKAESRTLYFVCGSSFGIIDAQDPTHPVIEFQYPYNYVNDVIERDGEIWGVAEGFFRIDRKNFQPPQEILATYKKPIVSGGGVCAFGSRGHLLLGVGSGSPGFSYSLDIMDRTDPSVTGIYSSSYSVYNISLGTKYACLYEGLDEGVEFFDLERYPLLHQVGQIPRYFSSEQLELTQDFAYLARAGKVEIYDLADPQHPELRSELFLPINFYSVKEFSGYLYLTGQVHYYAPSPSFDNLLVVIDATNPTQPKLVWYEDISGMPSFLEIENNKLYVNISPAIRVYDLSNPSQPVYLYNLGSVSDFNFVVDQNYCYLLRAKGLRIYTLGNPSSLVGSYLPENFLRGYVAVSGGYAYLEITAPDQSQRLEIVDLSNPTSPVLIKTIPQGVPGLLPDPDLYYPSFGYHRIKVVGSKLYLLHELNGLEAYDLTNPISPVLYAQFQPPLVSNNFDVQGQRIGIVNYGLTLLEMP